MLRGQSKAVAIFGVVKDCTDGTDVELVALGAERLPPSGQKRTQMQTHFLAPQAPRTESKARAAEFASQWLKNPKNAKVRWATPQEKAEARNQG